MLRRFTGIFAIVALAACAPEASNNNKETGAGMAGDGGDIGKIVQQPEGELLDPALVTVEQRFARLALDCVHRQFPNKIAHVLGSEEDAKPPKTLYPAFYGCFDWHSAVHGHWMLTRLWGQDAVPNMDAEIADALSRSFTEENLQTEAAYMQGENRASFERPYGLAWYLQLVAELEEIGAGEGPKAEQARIWRKTLAPLEMVIVRKVKSWVPKLAYPIRLGTHNQSAFAFGLMIDWARATGDGGLEKMLADKTLKFHANDVNCPIAYEPSGEDFLSPCLMEADLLRRVMTSDDFAKWLTAFLPQIPDDGSGDWLTPGIVTDATDGKLAHLDGVNLSRAWALEGIASALPQDDARTAALLAAAEIHKKTGIEAVSDEHYAGSHWLASFATYLVTKRGISSDVEKPADKDQ